MWNRQQEEESESGQPEPTPVDRPTQPISSRQPAVLGPSITIKGTLAGDEDLLIEGRVEGEVSFQKHSVTVGKSGRIKADLKCKNIYVEGQVYGNLYGEEVVVIKSSGKVNGNAVAPRVSLEDGCHFHGSIDMQPKGRNERSDRGASKAETQRVASSNESKDVAKNKPVSAGQTG